MNTFHKKGSDELAHSLSIRARPCPKPNVAQPYCYTLSGLRPAVAPPPPDGSTEDSRLKAWTRPCLLFNVLQLCLQNVLSVSTFQPLMLPCPGLLASLACIVVAASRLTSLCHLLLPLRGSPPQRPRSQILSLTCSLIKTLP